MIIEEGDGAVAFANHVGHVVPFLDGLSVVPDSSLAAFRTVLHDGRNLAGRLAHPNAVDALLIFSRFTPGASGRDYAAAERERKNGGGQAGLPPDRRPWLTAR